MRGVSWLVFVKYLVENNEIVKKYIIKSGLSVIDFCDPVALYVRARICARVWYITVWCYPVCRQKARTTMLPSPLVRYRFSRFS